MQSRLLLYVSLVASLAACVTPKSQVTMLQAPEVESASKYKSISVARFSGQGGDSVAASIEAALINAKVQDRPVYRSVLKAGDSRSLGTDNRSLAAAARSQGTDAILSGEVVAMRVTDTPFQQTEFVCDVYDQKSKWKCVSGRNVPVACIKRTGNMQVNVSLIDAQSGATVYQAAIPKGHEVSACKGAPLPTGPELLGTINNAIVDQVKRAIIPHERVMNIALMREDGDITARGARERFAGAIKFGEAGRMDRACETFAELYEADKRSVALSYNYGVCEEAAGAFWHADELYRMADKLTNEPNKLVSEALKRNNDAIKKAGNLAKNRSDLVAGTKVEGSSTQAAKQTVVQQIVVQGGAPSNITADVMMWDKRVALVIGNGKYPKSELINPPNDATAIANELRKANFKVIKIENATLAKMNQAIDEFGRSIPKDGIALVFYAGHGMQVKGENYLIPIDADLKSESDVAYKTINLGQILGKLEDGKSKVNLVILDACRDNPFARSWRSTKGGLAQIDAPSGTVIAFATAPGKVASDGTGANGLYTTHLLNALRAENLKLEDVLKLTRKGVAAESNNEQIPWDSSSLTGDFYFRVSKLEPTVSQSTLPPATNVQQPVAPASEIASRSLAISSARESPVTQPTNTSPQVESRPPDTPASTSQSSSDPIGGLFKSLGGFLKKIGE